tara:strand:- start:397 stop:675 length:279 start_codon:yes stop_codon:yes gene_type:complete
MSDYHETLLLRKEELEDIAYREQLEKEEYIKNNPYYWLVKAYRVKYKTYSNWEVWREWAKTKEELIKEIEEAHKKQLNVRIERFKRTLKDID